jgi:hypothetical protein
MQARFGRFWTFLDGTPKPDIFFPASAFAGIIGGQRTFWTRPGLRPKNVWCVPG